MIGRIQHWLRLRRRFPTTLAFQPLRDQDGEPCEDVDSYTHRMRNSVLKEWPEEVLREWLFRHADCMEDYAFLNFSRFHFRLETWTIDQLPGREAFASPQLCDEFQNVEKRAASRYDWLARFMMEHGTWNTPPILLDSIQLIVRKPNRPLRKPWHLLEGHRRLSFLQGLKRLELAQPDHVVWVVTISPRHKRV